MKRLLPQLVFCCYLACLLVGLGGTPLAASTPAFEELVLEGKRYWWEEHQILVPDFPITEQPENLCSDRAKGCAKVRAANAPCSIWVSPHLFPKSSIRVMAHEIGHCMGFVHSDTEGFPGVVPLEQSP